MARDKLITIRIEGEKRQAFGDLAKSQNTDTASLLYDFISQCLDSRIDISLVTGKGNRLDKIDNQIGSDRIDKLETDTQEIGERLDTIAKKLTDWVFSFDDRLNDCGRELSEKMISLEHRLSTLSIQLDSQEIDSIDTDSQQIDDMEPLLKRERESSIASPIPTIEETSPLPPSPSLPPDELGEGGNANTPDSPPSPLDQPAIGTLPTVETVSTNSSIELDKGAIGLVPGETDSSIDTGTGEAVTKTDSKPWYTAKELLDCHYSGWPKTKEGLRKKALTECWPRRTRRGSKGNPYEYQAVLPE